MTNPATNPIWDLPSVQIQIREAAQCYAQFAEDRHAKMLSVMGPLQREHESPIEAIFWIWWVTLEAISREFPFFLIPQYVVECEGQTYRLDFAVPQHFIAVELDGHDFHEKTKEQVNYRNQRDRALQALGWTVFHFSGSELYRDQMQCVVAVAELARERHDKAQRPNDATDTNDQA